MQEIFPAASGAELTDADLAALYAYPKRPWLRANMVTSVDGAATADERSAGLSSPADRRLFALMRGLADVILAGAGTARAEGYQPVRPREVWRDLRAGRTTTPPIAIVSGRLDLDPAAPLFAQAPPDARTIIITAQSSPAGRRAELAKNADVIVAGEVAIDAAAALAALAGRGLGHVLCEGGPALLGTLAAAGQLDELCLTVSPLLAGADAGRIVAGPQGKACGLALVSVLTEAGSLFCRYQTERAGPTGP